LILNLSIEMSMKYIVVIGDGMADYPLDELNGKTPLQISHTPHMDQIAMEGVSGLLETIPQGMEPGSDVANLSIMGYNPKEYYSGRGPLEAASIGADLSVNDVAFRCNLITQKDGLLEDFTADHISTNEASEIIESLNKDYGHYGHFYLGTSYRHLFVLRDKDSSRLKSTPPHDVVGEPVSDHMLKPEEDEIAKKLNSLMTNSIEKLNKHPLNQKRINNQHKPANMIWLWGQGPKPQMPSFFEKFGLHGATVTGVDLIKGIGVYLGLDNLKVPGATGYFDTDYCGKSKYALKALEDHDLVFVHIEAPDEAGHEGDLEEKINAIERIDKRILGKIMDQLPSYHDHAIAILPDHPTPLEIRTHTSDPVPFSIMGTVGKCDQVKRYDEFSAGNGSEGTIPGHMFIQTLIKGGK
jgi:2,3-bisphosphoglycerate-independent phosphoglycerate mutase